MKKIVILLLFPLYIQGQAPGVEASRSWVAGHGSEILDEFAELLKLPNHASDLPNINLNAEKLQALFGARGFDMKLLRLPDAPPIVYGEHKVANATRTISFYVHYDGQPVDPDSWEHPPFEPVLYDGPMDRGGNKIDFPKPGEEIDPEWRVYARSSSDDKAPLMSLMAAIDALKEAGIGYTSNIKLFFDGEEESGSPHVQAYLQNNPDLFEDIDVWLICDGSVFQTGAPQFKFGGRGITSMELTVYGAARPLHSGHYGNWAPVPGQTLARLLTSMKDENGKVLVEGFYDSVEPISATERDQINNIPPLEEQLKRELGLVTTEGEGQRLNERLLLPSLTVRGLSSGNVGTKSRNIIPNIAIATLGMRLVKGNDPDKMLDLVEAHIRKEGWHIVYEEPDMETRLQHPRIVKVTRTATGLKAAKTSMDHPKVEPIIETMRAFTNDKMVLLPSSGGSNRVYYVIFEVLKKPGIGVNMVNHDNNQHAANENVRLGNLWYGVELMATLLTMQ